MDLKESRAAMRQNTRSTMLTIILIGLSAAMAATSVPTPVPLAWSGWPQQLDIQPGLFP